MARQGLVELLRPLDRAAVGRLLPAGSDRLIPAVADAVRVDLSPAERRRAHESARGTAGARAGRR